MSTRADQLGTIAGEDPRRAASRAEQLSGPDPRGISPARAALRLALARRRVANPVTQEDFGLSTFDRLAAEFGRGLKDELTFGHGEGVRDQTLDPNQAPERAGLRESLKYIDATDVAAGVGRLVGMAPAIMTGATLANLGAKFLAKRAVAAGAPRAGRFLSALAGHAPEDAGTLLRLAGSPAGRNMYEGFIYSTGTEPLRAIEEGQSRARSIALNTGIGAAADFLLGAAIPYARAPLRTLVGRLQASDNSVDREIAEELMKRFEARTAEPIGGARESGDVVRDAAGARRRVDASDPMAQQNIARERARALQRQELESEVEGGERRIQTEPERTPGGPIATEAPIAGRTTDPRLAPDPERARLLSDEDVPVVEGPRPRPVREGIEVVQPIGGRGDAGAETRARAAATEPERGHLVLDSDIPIIGARAARLGGDAPAAARVTSEEVPDEVLNDPVVQRAMELDPQLGEDVRRLTDRVRYDALTQAGSREAFQKARATLDADESLAAVAFDLNNFSVKNNRQGHDAGDEFLQRVAAAFRKVARDMEIPVRDFRTGGDEFTTYVPTARADEFRAAVEREVGVEDIEGFPVGVSGSVGPTASAADAGLEVAKRRATGGRQARPRSRAEALGAEPEPTAAPDRASQLLSEEDRAALSRPGRQALEAIGEATTEREVVAQAANVSQLASGDQAILADLIQARLSVLRAGREAPAPKGEAPAASPAARRQAPPRSPGDLDARAAIEGEASQGSPAPTEAGRRLVAATDDLTSRANAQQARSSEAVPVGEKVAGVEGRPAPVKPADGLEAIPARYRVIEADALQPSHNAETFQQNPRYPEGVQERPYDADQVLQEHTADAAQHLDPDQLLDPTVGNATGPPVVRPDGVVLGGNGRSMMLQRAARRHPDRFAAYRAEMERRAESLGLDPELVKQMDAPVLVRETDAGATRDQLRAIGERLNVDPQKGRDPLSDAASRAARLTRSSAALEHIEATIAPDQTVRDYLGTADGRRFMERLIDDGVIEQQKASEFIDADGFATPAGREMVENALLVAAVGDAQVVGRALADAKSTVNALIHATPAILRARGVDGFNIHVALQDALDLVVEARRSGMKLNDLLAQGGLFAARDDNPYARTLARFIDGNTPTRVRTAFREFAADAVRQAEGVGEDLFGELISFSGTFERVFDAAAADDALLRELGERVGEVVDLATPAGRFDEPRPERAATDLRTLGVTSEDAQAVLRALREAGEETAATSGGLVRISRRMFQRATNWMKSLGESGTRLADDIDAVDNRAAKEEARDLRRLEDALKGLSLAQRVKVAKVGAGTLDRSRVDPALVQRADAVREILDRAMPAANAVGLRRLVRGERVEIGGSGKWMPQVPNREGQRVLDAAVEKGLADPAVRQWAEEMVRDGLAVDLADARRRIVGYRNRVLAGQEGGTLGEQLRGVDPYLESTRFVIPDRYRDWDVAQILPRLVERNWLTIEAARQWGPSLEAAGKLIRATELESEPGVGRIIQDFIAHRLGVGGLVVRSDARLASHLSSYETVMRLGYSVLSTVRQIGQRVTNTADLPLAVQFRALAEFPPILNRWLPSAKRIRDAIQESGAVRARTPLTQIESGGGFSERFARKSLELSGFMAGERGNQYTTALMARYAIEHDMRKLMRLGEMGGVQKTLEGLVRLTLPTGGGIEGAITRRLNRGGMTDEAIAKAIREGGSITPDQFELAMHRANKDRNFALTFATERVWWSNSPWLRLAAKFKPFVLDQTGLIWNNVIREAVKGHTAPLVKFLGWTFLMGEVYNVARDLVTGDEESFTFSELNDPAANNSTRELGLRVLKNIGDGGGLGLLQDVLYGLSDFIAGPFYGSTLTNLGEAAIHSIQRPGQTGRAVAQFVRRESSVLKQAQPLAQRLRRRSDEDNRYFEVRTWRRRGFDWRRDHEAEGPGDMVQRAAVEAITGRFRRFTPTENTLSYAYAAEAVTAGELEDATEYLTGTLSGLTAEELETRVDGIRQSMAARSPLGPVAEAERAAFLRKYPTSQYTAALLLNGRWRRDYLQALGGALTAAKPPEDADARSMRDFELMKRRLTLRLRVAARAESGRERKVLREIRRP